MARIRSIHPSLWTDEDFVVLAPFARLLYLGLLNEADDNGIFPWRPLQLKMRILPADNVDVSELLTEIEARGLVWRYQADGGDYGMLRNFQKYQSPHKPSFQYLLPPGPLPQGFTFHPKAAELSLFADDSDSPPYRSGTARDDSGTARDESGTTSDRSGTPCDHSGNAADRSGTTPDHSGTAPGNPGKSTSEGRGKGGEKDLEEDLEKDQEKDQERKGKRRGNGNLVPFGPPLDEIRDEWNQMADRFGLPKVMSWGNGTSNRKKATRERWKDPYWRNNWREAIRRIPWQPWRLQGSKERPDWKANIDYFLREQTVTRLMEEVPPKDKTWSYSEGGEFQ